MSFNYKKTFTVDHTQCGTADSTDFPILLYFPDADLKTVGNGGYVESNSGFDIRPYADAALTVPLTFELVAYAPTTGVLQMWVKVGTLDHSSDVTYYLAYGNTALVTDGSSAATWNADYKAVYHSEAFTGGGTLLPSATGTDDLTVNGGSIQGSSIISNGYLASSVSEDDTPITAPPLTCEMWIRSTSAPTDGGAFMILNVTGGSGWNGFYGFITQSTTTAQITTVDSNFTNFSSATKTFPNDTNWHHCMFVVTSSTSRQMFVDGVGGTVDTTSVTPTGALPPERFAISIAGPLSTNDNPFTSGLFDEMRLSATARSSSWAKASYNNQKASSTFLTLGPQTTVGGTFILIPGR